MLERQRYFVRYEIYKRFKRHIKETLNIIIYFSTRPIISHCLSTHIYLILTVYEQKRAINTYNTTNDTSSMITLIDKLLASLPEMQGVDSEEIENVKDDLEP
mgnify:CR=1 FL=1